MSVYNISLYVITVPGTVQYSEYTASVLVQIVLRSTVQVLVLVTVYENRTTANMMRAQILVPTTVHICTIYA